VRPVYPGAVSDDELARCTLDIDTEVFEAIRRAWLAEGVRRRRFGRISRKKGKAASDRLLRENPELIDTLARRYQSLTGDDERPSHVASVGLWMFKHQDEMGAFRDSL
jgi:hypothetical protein